MAVVQNAPIFIDPPPPPPAPPGIFDVALGPMPFPDPVAEGFGVMYLPDVCPTGNPQLYLVNCPTVSGSYTFNALAAAVSGAPFAVATTITCSSVGMSPDELAKRVALRLQLREQMGVEQRIWQGSTGPGAIGQIPGLLRGATDVGASSCVTEAIEQLEQTLATNQVIGGMIHARPGMAAHLSQGKLLKQGANNRQLTTWLGTPINFGYGYDGTGPTGQAPDTDKEYMYATGRTLIWRDADIVTQPWQQMLNTSTNTITMLAQRVYVVAIECGVWSTQVTRNCTTAT